MATSPASVPWHNNEPCVVGIDEAGRGPVLGPMVYTAAVCPVSLLPSLHALGADDSKQLSEEQRDRLRAKIDGAPFLCTWSRVLSADELSRAMLRRRRYNLNAISHDAALDLVDDVLRRGVNVAEIYVDTVGDPVRYADKFQRRFPGVGKVVVAKKADATYRIVGAASIVAKTTRDAEVKGWVFAEEARSADGGGEGGDARVLFPELRGSGYPGDPATKRWLQGSCDPIFGFPTLVRFSWGTAKTIMEKECVRVDWDSDEEEDEEARTGPGYRGAVKTKDIKSFFGTKATRGEEQPQTKRRKTSTAARTMRAVPKLMRSMGLERVNSLV